MKIKEIEKTAKDVLEKIGHHSPQVMFMHNGKMNINILKFENEIEKRAMLLGLRKIIHKHKITSYCTIMEAWMSIREGDSKTPYVRPKNDPDRKQALIITIFNKDLTFETSMNIFEKDGDKIKWLERKHETRKEFKEYYSPWNVYLEDSPDIDEYINKRLGK